MIEDKKVIDKAKRLGLRSFDYRESIGLYLINSDLSLLNNVFFPSKTIAAKVYLAIKLD